MLPSPSRVRAAAVTAAVLAILLSIVPAGARPARAADSDFRLEAAATYTLDPTAGAVHVRIAATGTNRKPDSALYRYYYTGFTIGIHEDAAAVKATDSRGSLRTKVTDKDGYKVLEVRFRSSIFYRQSRSVTVTYDLPGGEPRSDTPTRAGLAFASFDVWAWGDPGYSSVRVDLPSGFEPETYGDTLIEAVGPDGVSLGDDDVTDSSEFWVGVTAIDESAYSTETLEFEGGVRLEVRAWPEDPEWATTVSETLREGLPDLLERVGLDWPVDEVITVTEVYSILLAGYAGVYLTREDRIEISEDLDELTTLHEASHAWFNERLFTERWISEGLAETYSALVWKAMGGRPVAPIRPLTTADGYRLLSTWEHPGRIEDEEDEASEDYGYNASYWLISALVREVGEDGMREVLAAAADDEIAYLGAGEPETVPTKDDWRRFLDLLEERAGSTQAADLLRAWVQGAQGDALLDRRAEARAEYADLIDAGDGWLPPYAVRRNLSAWLFEQAESAMEEAHAVLALRDEVVADAAALGLEIGADFETTYEAVEEDFGPAIEVGESLADALDVLAETRATLDAEPDLATTVGLWGETPEAPWDEATTAFEADDPDAAVEAAERAAAIVSGAAEVGQQRILVAVGVTGTGILLIVVLVVVRRRRSRARRLALVAAASATLAATPDAVPMPAPSAGQDGGAEGADADAAAADPPPG